MCVWPFRKRNRQHRLNPLVQEFVDKCPVLLGEMLASYHFEFQKQRTHNDCCAQRTYRSGPRYIEVSISTNYLDGPSHCSIMLGEGSDEWIETDWNKIALWQMWERNISREPYEIDVCGSVESAIRRIADDVRKHASDFLAGDLERFYAARRESVRQRDPYMIYKPRGFFRGYETIADRESAAMKEKYSK